MRIIPFIFIILAGCLITACQSNTLEEEVITGNLMEVEPSQEELDAIALESQEKIIQDFFAISPSLFGDRFCYDHNSISQLILHGNNEEDTWTKFEATNNYLTLYHSECDVMLEFMTFEMGSKKMAYLSQMNHGNQLFNCLVWDEEKATWKNRSNFPRPQLSDYFIDLSPEEIDAVNEYGADFVYIDPVDNSAAFLFSEWAMQMNMGEKQMDEFNHEAAYNFDLITSNGHFDLQVSPILTGQQKSSNFFVAYTKDSVPSEQFSALYAEACAELATVNLSAQLITYGSNDFNVYFPTDTFNFQHMEQFEPRDGFWFYKKGSEPIDLSAEVGINTVITQAKAYFSEEF